MSASWQEDEEREWNRLPSSAARVLADMIEPGWTVDAACVSIDPELWFPAEGGTTSRAVLEICASCPVRASCLATAIVNVEDGIWGGVQERPRRRARVQIAHGGDPLLVLDAMLDQATESDTRRRVAA